MKAMSWKATVMMGALAMMIPAATVPGTAAAAPWLSPAADEKLAAGWVKDIAAEFRKERYKQVFMNAPFGSPQSSMLGLLNDAAEALQEGEKAYARDLIRHALGILDDGVEQGWYSRSNIEPIKGMIISKANVGMRTAGKGSDRSQMSQRSQRGGDQYGSREGFDEPIFGGPDDYEIYGGEGDRWTGYTKNRRMGLTERLDTSHPASRFEDEAEYRDRQRGQEGRMTGDRDRSRGSRTSDPYDRDWDQLGPQRSKDQSTRAERSGSRGRDRGEGAERGGTARYYSDDFYYSDEFNKRFGPEDRDRQSRTSQRYESDGRDQEQTDSRIQQDRKKHRRANERFHDGERQWNER